MDTCTLNYNIPLHYQLYIYIYIYTQKMTVQYNV